MGTWAADIGIALDHRADVPLGVQLDWGIRAAVASGRLSPGERLPALRELAAELGVNHNTLRAAVAKLEHEGLLESRHGTGTFVASGAAAHDRHAALVEQVMRHAHDAGVSPRDLAAALYVAPHETPALAEPDADASERRALRQEIATLERLVNDLEAKLPKRPRPVESRAPGGPRLLGVTELAAKRDELVRRLALARLALDDDGEDAAAEPEPAPAAAAAKRRAPRRAPRPGVSPA